MDIDSTKLEDQKESKDEEFIEENDKYEDGVFPRPKRIKTSTNLNFNYNDFLIQRKQASQKNFKFQFSGVHSVKNEIIEENDDESLLENDMVIGEKLEANQEDLIRRVLIREEITKHLDEDAE